MTVKFDFFGTRSVIEDKFAETKVNLRKNFYAVGHDEKGKSYVTDIDNALFGEARAEGKAWAKENKLTFDGVYSNN